MACYRVNFDIIEYLMNELPENKQIDVNAIDLYGRTGIFLVIDNVFSAFYEKKMDAAIKCLKFLVNDPFKRVNINHKDQRNDTPLFHAFKKLYIFCFLVNCLFVFLRNTVEKKQNMQKRINAEAQYPKTNKK